MDFVEICNVYIGKMIFKAAKRIFNSDKICHSYSDLNIGVTCFGTQCSIPQRCAARTRLTEVNSTYVMNANCKLRFSFESYPLSFLHFTCSVFSDVEAHLKVSAMHPSPKCADCVVADADERGVADIRISGVLCCTPGW